MLHPLLFLPVSNQLGTGHGCDETFPQLRQQGPKVVVGVLRYALEILGTADLFLGKPQIKITFMLRPVCIFTVYSHKGTVVLFQCLHEI